MEGRLYFSLQNIFNMELQIGKFEVIDNFQKITPIDKQQKKFLFGREYEDGREINVFIGLDSNIIINCDRKIYQFPFAEKEKAEALYNQFCQSQGRIDFINFTHYK